MEISVHDNILYGYTVVREGYNSHVYTITLYTEFLDNSPVEYTDIVFTGVAAHHFESELANSILFDVEKTEPERIYNDNQELFERLKNYGWPWMYTTTEELFAAIKTRQLKAFAISASYGIDGWIWAKDMRKIPRAERKEFD